MVDHFTPSALSAVFLLCLTAPATADEAQSPADSSVHFQSTYVWQNKPGMPAAYSGPNSLRAEREKSYTFTATGYFGLRPWQGGEIYLNAEITQGVPFSGLNGSAAFTNGELTRTGSSTPKLYRQRLFLRQTWGLGGERQPVESDINQIAGSVDANRVVLTLGNFSTLDVFDNNAYAKDPRTQFMNAGFMAPLAYDYAADARGFGWGVALEWYREAWVYRIGRMTGPQEPNMLPTDFQIGRHYGDQIEIEHAHQLLGQPGKLRVLVWRNRAKLASFDDALAYLQSHPGADPQAIVAVRNGERMKSGIGVNLEQAIDDSLGLFLRAMQADGGSETFAFTETDASLSLGAALKGAAWGRGRDTVGLGYVRNSLSRARRHYLQAGGISFFIGDGRLNYRPEQVLESYYSLNVAPAAYITFDYQRMHNPAYNADRGPANVYAVRAHVDF